MMNVTKGTKRTLFCNTNRNESCPRKLSKLDDNQADRNESAVIFKNGLPVLPPIKNYDFSYDPWQKSKLMTHKRVKEQNRVLMKYFQCQALKEAREERMRFKQLQLRKKQECEVEPPLRPEFMPSEDHCLKMNYLALKKFIMNTPVAPMDQTSHDRIVRLIPEKLRTGPVKEKKIKELFEEVNVMFVKSIEMSNIQHILIKPEVKGLETEKAGPPPSEPLGLNFRRPWHDEYLERRMKIFQTLNLLNPTHTAVLEFCQSSIAKYSLLEISPYRAMGVITLEEFMACIDRDFATNENKFMKSWYPKVLNIFSTNFLSMGLDSAEKMESFYKSTSTLIGIQIKQMLVTTLKRYEKLFRPENSLKLFQLQLNLDLVDNQIKFTNSVEDVIEAILYYVKRLCTSLQKVPTVRSYLEWKKEDACIDTSISTHIINEICQKLEIHVRRYYAEATKLLNKFTDEYGHIVNGETAADIEDYLKCDHSFTQHKEFINEFYQMISEIQSLPSTESYDLLTVFCEDLKTGLVETSRLLCHGLLVAVIEEHRIENIKLWIATLHNIIRDGGYIRGKPGSAKKKDPPKKLNNSQSSENTTVAGSQTPVGSTQGSVTSSFSAPGAADTLILDTSIQFDWVSPSEESRAVTTPQSGPPKRLNPFDQSSAVVLNPAFDNAAFSETFTTRFLGSMEVKGDRGEQLVHSTIRQIMAARAIHNIFKMTESLMVVSSEGMRLIDPSNNIIRVEFALQDISFWSAHPDNNRLFGFITRNRTLANTAVDGKQSDGDRNQNAAPSFACHVFESNTTAEDICQAISTATKVAFQALMEKRKGITPTTPAAPKPKAQLNEKNLLLKNIQSLPTETGNKKSKAGFDEVDSLQDDPYDDLNSRLPLSPDGKFLILTVLDEPPSPTIASPESSLKHSEESTGAEGEDSESEA